MPEVNSLGLFPTPHAMHVAEEGRDGELSGRLNAVGLRTRKVEHVAPLIGEVAYPAIGESSHGAVEDASMSFYAETDASKRPACVYLGLPVACRLVSPAIT
jgi:hypothetical protein